LIVSTARGTEPDSKPRGVRARREHPLLSAAQLRPGNHLHGLGDLLRVLDAADPAPESIVLWHE